MNERTGGWIQTYRGVAFYPLDPRVDEILIEDIAHSLALQCRFTGHCQRFYSVAQHSVLVSQVCPPKHALWGLLHDASEAYLSDVARPVKYDTLLQRYLIAEKHLQTFVAERFGLDVFEPPEVKQADICLLGIEARDLMSPLTQPENWKRFTDAIGDCTIRITRTWSPDEAEERFLERFHELTSGANVSKAARLLASARKLRQRATEALPALFQH